MSWAAWRDAWGEAWGRAWGYVASVLSRFARPGETTRATPQRDAAADVVMSESAPRVLAPLVEAESNGVVGVFCGCLNIAPTSARDAAVFVSSRDVGATIGDP